MMVMKRICSFLIIFLFLLIGIGAKEITILYTSSLNGNIDGCECKTAPKSGLISSAVLLRQMAEEALYFDLGDSLDVYPDEDLSNLILTSYIGLGIDVSALGDQEFTEGVDWLLDQDFPYLAGNMSIDGVPLTPEYQIIEKDGVKIGVVSVTDPGTFFFASDEIKERLVLSDPFQFASTIHDSLEEEDVEVSILLFHGASDKAEILFSEIQEYDVVLTGHDQRLIEQLSSNNRRFFGSPGENGNRIGLLTINVWGGRVRKIENRFHLFDYYVDPRDPIIVRSLDQYKRMMIDRLRNDS